MANAKVSESRAADIIKYWLRTRYVIEFLSAWEQINNPTFKVVESDHFKIQAGLPNFVISASEWIEKTNAIGITVKKWKYGGTYAHKDIAFEFGSAISEYSPEDNLLYGKVLGISGLLSYEGETGKLLEDDFREAVDAYLTDCKAEGKIPEKPFKGSFNVRIPAGLHQKAALMAMETKTSLNNFVAEAIRYRVSKEPA